MNKYLKFTLSILILFLIISCGSSKGNRGKQQPKKGPMPCPSHDCL